MCDIEVTSYGVSQRTIQQYIAPCSLKLKATPEKLMRSIFQQVYSRIHDFEKVI